MSHDAWVGVDLDGTLAHYEGWNGGAIGRPIPRMVARVRLWVELGYQIRIMTARVACDEPERSQRIAEIGAWCQAHLGLTLPVVSQKDYGMVELWDDRVVTVEPNTGRALAPSRNGLPEPEHFEEGTHA